MSEDALRKTYEHIELVSKLLMSCQIELMKRQVTHDRSKLEEPEWSMFDKVTHKLEGLTYGSDEYEAQRKEMLGLALSHHYEHNRHHPEFFTDNSSNESSSQSSGVNSMNLFDVLEMCCDWVAACKRHKDGSIYKSIEINKERFDISEQLTQIILNTIPYIKNEFEGLNTQMDL